MNKDKYKLTQLRVETREDKELNEVELTIKKGDEVVAKTFVNNNINCAINYLFWWLEQ